MMMKEEAIKLHEARYWAEEARRCARISRWLGWLAIALAVTGVALSAWSIFLKHRAVGKDGVGRAAPVEIERTGEVGASTSRDVADGGTVERPFTESVRKRDTSHADLADGERHGAVNGAGQDRRKPIMTISLSMVEMKNKKGKTMRYIRVNHVDAEPMAFGEFKEKFPKSGGANIERDPADEGYVITYRKGRPNEYVSWCPKAEFEAVSRPVEGMTFGMAIEAMKRGKKVTRRGWNGKGMFLWLKPAANIKAEWCKDEMLKGLVEANGGEIIGLGTICMYTHDATGRKAILTGWLASQSDMLSEDWAIVE